MQRYKLCICYKGKGYHGWQKQKYTDNTIQSKLESIIYLALGENVSLCVAGRTDSGVSAKKQFVHFDISREINSKLLLNTINIHMNCNNIFIQSVEKVSTDFHARFSAKHRSYIYIVHNIFPIDSYNKEDFWCVGGDIDIDNMNSAAQLLIGNHDFSAFCTRFANKPKTKRKILKIRIIKMKNFIYFYFCAQSFLHNQVRILVGTLVEMFGKKNNHPEYIKNVLYSQNRCLAGPTAPPNGLYLINIKY